MKIIGIPLALGHLYEGKGSGPLVRPLDGGIQRYYALMDAIERHVQASGYKTPWKICCTAGFSRENPTRDVSNTGDCASLGQQLKRFIEEHDPAGAALIAKNHNGLAVPPLGWGTESEIKNGIELAMQDGFMPDDPSVTLLVATNRAHHLRVGMYVDAYKPPAWKYRPVTAKHHFSMRSHISEFLKIARDWRRLRGLALQNASTAGARMQAA